MSVPNLKWIALFLQKLLGDVRRNRTKIANFHTPRVFNAPADGVPLEFGIGVRGPECFYDVAIRWSKKFSDRFSRFDTIPAVTDSHPASHVAVAITLNALAKASSLKTT